MSSSKSFKMVRDTVRYKQLCIKTIPKHEFQEIHGSKTLKFPGARFRGFVGGTLGGTLGRASDDEHSKSFKMVRDTVRYKQFCIKTVSNTSFKTHMRH